MKLKIDENLPVDCAVILRDAGFEADTVLDERLEADDSVIASRSRAEDRVLVTLDRLILAVARGALGTFGSSERIEFVSAL